jgi:hypothetical protein
LRIAGGRIMPSAAAAVCTVAHFATIRMPAAGLAMRAAAVAADCSRADWNAS